MAFIKAPTSERQLNNGKIFDYKVKIFCGLKIL